MYKYINFSLLLCIVLCACKNSNYHKGKCLDWHTIPEDIKPPDSLTYLTFLFDDVLNNDRVYRCSPDNSYFFKHVTEQNKLDSVNQTIILNIIRQYGFKGPKQFGWHGYFAIINVIQHSGRRTQELIYPLYRKLFNDSSMGGGDLALFEDRLNVHRKRKQYFGTQIRYNNTIKSYTIYPLYNPDSVNYYRKEIGMKDTFEEYLLTHFNIKWDVEKYKRELPALMQDLHFTDSLGFYYKNPIPNFIKIDSSLLK